jgi:ABC-type nitrate/sulfonate/bicarbonate transport system permease component
MAPDEGSSAAGRTGKGLNYFSFGYEGFVALAGLALVWQIASFFIPHFLFPSVPEIAARLFAIFTSWNSVADALATSARILAGLTGAFGSARFWPCRWRVRRLSSVTLTRC